MNISRNLRGKELLDKYNLSSAGRQLLFFLCYVNRCGEELMVKRDEVTGMLGISNAKITYVMKELFEKEILLKKSMIRGGYIVKINDEVRTVLSKIKY